MNDLEIWKERVQNLWNAELLFDELKADKKVNKKQIRKIEAKLRKATYRLWIASPKIKNNPSLRKGVIQECLADWKSFNRVSKSVSDIKSSHSTESIM